jgi:FkbM family methyltransferase
MGDTFVDVGAFIGLYTVAAAKRIGPAGKVIAFEPDPANAAALQVHLRLNEVSDRVDIIQAAATDHGGSVAFNGTGGCESHVDPASVGKRVKAMRLDDVSEQRVDLLKIDVEGHEEAVLRGAAKLLRDPKRAPGLVYVEVHPYAWKALGTTSDSLLACLKETGYELTTPDGNPVTSINAWGELIATKSSGSA